MNNPTPLFGTGLARSGGALYSMCLSTHPQIMAACCPNLELFRSLRNAVVEQTKNDALSRMFPPTAPIQDYYFTPPRIELLDHMLSTDLNISFNGNEWQQFHQTSVARGNLETPDLTGHYHRLKGTSYKAIFDNLLHIIAAARQAQDRRWVGFHEAWTLDTYPALARAYPDARFLIMLRDPRAIINSMLAVEHIEPSQVAQVLSYVRHWRKYVALALHFSQDTLFKGRLFITSHDSILHYPRQTVSAICEFLDVSFDERMLNTDNFIDYATGKTWIGNSSFEQKTVGIAAHRATRWQQKLDSTVLKSIEYLCGPELVLANYEPVTAFAALSAEMDDEIFHFLLQDHHAYANWRSDLGDPLHDVGAELFRRQLLRSKNRSEDISLIRTCFLFEHVYDALRSGKSTVMSNIEY